MKAFRPALVLLSAFTILTGILYPVGLTAFATVAFRDKAAGSPIESKGVIVGSRLVGQSFTGDRFFWGRPSATPERPYNAASSSGSNLGPTNPALRDAVNERVARLKAAHPDGGEPPVDLITSSGSGLDPDISPEAALYQCRRVAKARGMSEAAVRTLIERRIEDRWLGVFGEPRVNVLLLNLDLEAAGVSN